MGNTSGKTNNANTNNTTAPTKRAPSEPELDESHFKKIEECTKEFPVVEVPRDKEGYIQSFTLDQGKTKMNPIQI